MASARLNVTWAEVEKLGRNWYDRQLCGFALTSVPGWKLVVDSTRLAISLAVRDYVMAR